LIFGDSEGAFIAGTGQLILTDPFPVLSLVPFLELEEGSDVGLKLHDGNEDGSFDGKTLGSSDGRREG